MLDRVVRCGVELKDVQRSLLVKALARFTLITSLAFSRRVLAVDGLGKDTCAGGFTHTTWSAEQIGMSQLPTLHCVLQCSSEGRLTYHCIKAQRTVFSGRNDIFHIAIY